MNTRKNKSSLFYLHSIKGSLTILLADAILILIITGVLLQPSPLSINPEPFSYHYFFLFILFLLSAILITFSINQLYTVTESTTSFSLAKKICLSFFITCLSVFTFGYFSPHFHNLNWSLIPALLTTFICLFIFRYFLLFNCQKNRSRVLILGANELSKKIIEVNQKRRFKPYEIIGLTSTNAQMVNTSFHGTPVLGFIDDLDSIVKQYRPDCIVVALRNRRGKLPVRILLQIKTSGIRIMECTTFYEQITQKIVVDEFLKPSWFIFEEGFSSSPIYKSIKRIQGFFISMILLVILSPFLACIALAIKLDSRGPIFYIQQRIGLNGEIFKLIKFRSMYHQTEESSQAQFTTKNDPRITRVGSLLEMATGQKISRSEQDKPMLKVDPESGEVIMKFKLPGF